MTTNTSDDLLPVTQEDEAFRDALSAAYTAGAEDVHREWIANPDGHREPDFTEAASDYATWAIEGLRERQPTVPVHGVGSTEYAARKAVNTVLARLLEPLIPDLCERIEVGNRNCTAILVALDRLKAASPTPDDGGEI